jgi:hypothetical protein
VQVPQVDLPMIGLHMLNQEQSRENRTNHMWGKLREEDINLKNNFMNTIVYRVRLKIPIT